MVESKEIAHKMRADANELEQTAARLAREAKLLRETAYQLNPIGRKPGSRVRKRKPKGKPVSQPEPRRSQKSPEPELATSSDTPPVTGAVMAALRQNGAATSSQLARDLVLHPEVIGAAVRDLLAAGSITRIEDNDAGASLYAVAEA